LEGNEEGVEDLEDKLEETMPTPKASDANAKGGSSSSRINSKAEAKGKRSEQHLQPQEALNRHTRAKTERQSEAKSAPSKQTNPGKRAKEEPASKSASTRKQRGIAKSKMRAKRVRK